MTFVAFKKLLGAWTPCEVLTTDCRSMGGTKVHGWHKRRTKRQMDGTIYAVDGNI
jgi:hypothetical protein